MTGLLALCLFGPVLATAADELAPRILWSRSLADAPTGVAAGKGLAFAALMDGTLRAYRMADGAEAWKAVLGDAPRTAPAFVDGTVVVATAARRLLAFDAATGDRRWQAVMQAQPTSDPGLDAVLVAIGEGNKTCAAYNLSDGKPLWRFTVTGEVVGAPWVGDRRVVFGATGHTVYAVAKLTGAVERQLTLPGEAVGRPGGDPLAGDRSVIAVGTHEGRLHAIAESWARAWSRKVRGVVRARPLVGPDTVFAGTDHAVAYALDKGDGSVRWRTGVGGGVVERLVLLPAGLVVAAGGTLTFLDPKRGRMTTQIPAGGLLAGMAETDGTLVAATVNRRLFAAGVRVSGIEAAPVTRPALESVVVDPLVAVPKKGRGTAVTFSLTEPRSLVVDVSDARGRRVKLLANRERAWPDTYRYEWDGMTETGEPAVPGVYRIRVVAGEEEAAVGLEVVGGR